MKYLLLLAIVLAVIWFLRSNRRGEERGKEPPRQQGTPGEPQDMVRCQVCSVHLPRTDALPGPGERYYCCADHRARGGD